MLIQPVQHDDALLADIAAGQRARDGALRLWWLGQSGFLVQWRGHHLLLDPYLSDSLTTKYAATDKPHVRMTARVVDPRRLDMIEVVTSSHNHTDHLDHETLWPLLAANPGLTLVIPEANRQFVADRLDTDPAWPIGVDGRFVGRRRSVPPDRSRRRARAARRRRRGPATPPRLPRRRRAVHAVPLRRRRAVRRHGVEAPRDSPAGGRSTSRCCRSTVGCRSGVCRATSGATRRSASPRHRRPIGGADALRDVRLQHRDARAVRIDGAGARPAVPRPALRRAVDDPRRGDTWR